MKPKILLLDIETSPIISYTWGIFDQDIGLNQIYQDWRILSWAAKWYGESDNRIMYQDQRKSKSINNEKKILQGIWDLLDQADVVLTQNGKRFDIKKLNAKFVEYKFKPPSSYKQIDTLTLTKKYFAFTSHKLEYMTKLLCPEHKKSSHKKFPGFELWKKCLAGNQDAWNEMEIYNRQDVIALEHLYNKVKAWDNSINFDLYNDDLIHTCKCGKANFKKQGYAYTSVGKFQRYKCKNCGSESRDRKNLFTKEKRDSLRIGK